MHVSLEACAPAGPGTSTCLYSVTMELTMVRKLIGHQGVFALAATWAGVC